jgi:hypothetical protein
MTRAIAETPIPHLLRAVMNFSPLVPLAIAEIDCAIGKFLPSRIVRYDNNSSSIFIQPGFGEELGRRRQWRKDAFISGNAWRWLWQSNRV